jgi:hypothetical protein
MIGNGLEIKRNSFEFTISRTQELWNTITIITILFLIIPFLRKYFFKLLIFNIILFLFIYWYTFTFTLLNPASCLLYRNEEIEAQPVQLQNLTRTNLLEAVNFIDNVENDKPFFLYFAAIKVHTGFFFLLFFIALFTTPEFENITKHGAYADNVHEMDWSVGELIKAVKNKGLEDDTVFFFTSDNGPFVIRGHEAGSCGNAVDKFGNVKGEYRGIYY